MLPHPPSKISFGFIGDAGKNTKNAAKLRNSLARSGVTTLINAGDNLYSTIPDLVGKISSRLKSYLPHESYEDVWRIWQQSGFNFFALAIGNHSKSAEEEVRFFNLPGTYYSNNIPQFVRVIVLDSNDARNAPKQAEFLQQELTKATEPFVFVVYHQPPFNLFRGIHSNKSNHFHNVISPILIMYRKKITALLLGHEHFALLANWYNIPCIMNGAGQGTTHWSQVLSDGAAEVFWYNTGHPYWVHIELNAQTRIADCKYINADDNQCKSRARIRTGFPLQKFLN